MFEDGCVAKNSRSWVLPARLIPARPAGLKSAEVVLPLENCGSVATAAMSQEISDKPVQCTKQDTDRYGRVVAICHLDGRDIGADMVRHGWAIEYRRYSHGLYATEETAARAAKRGIWRGRFEEPAQWRAEHRERR